MPVPHLEIRIVQRSKGSSAVAGAAYQAGEKLFSEYDQKSKDHRRKQPEVLYTEIMFPANAPPEYADRATLWNAVEEVEKQWNSQLARRFILALPREVPTEMYPQMMQEYCREHFVSKGMCCDFAIHDPDPPGHNPHCHIMLTMRAIDENGKWLPKSRKVYDLDENGERIKLPSGNWKSHKEDTVDWNEQYHAEEWRHGWELVQNKYLELAGSPERVDMRSYERQGLDKIPTVHMGAAVCALERKGIETNIGNLNRDIKAANRMMNAIRSTIQNLRNWIADIVEATKEAFAEVALVNSVREAIDSVTAAEGERPLVVTTDARTYENTVTYAQMRENLEKGTRPVLVLFGTGYGMTKETMREFDYILEPVYGHGPYNHLSVRSAVSIILDRLRGEEWWLKR